MLRISQEVRDFQTMERNIDSSLHLSACSKMIHGGVIHFTLASRAYVRKEDSSVKELEKPRLNRRSQEFRLSQCLPDISKVYGGNEKEQVLLSLS